MEEIKIRRQERQDYYYYEISRSTLGFSKLRNIEEREKDVFIIKRWLLPGSVRALRNTF